MPQKKHSIFPPLSTILWKCFKDPLRISKSSFRTHILMRNPDPDCFWHSVQWHRYNIRVSLWFDIGPHRIDNFPLKNGSCWSFNDYFSESCGLNDFPVNALLPVFLRFVKGSRILFVYQWHSVHSNNINLICCSGFFWVYSFKVTVLLIFLHFLRSIFFRH